MDKSANTQAHSDPTKPVIPAVHKKKSVGWMIFIAFNISVPFFFLILYFWMQSQ